MWFPNPFRSSLTRIAILFIAAFSFFSSDAVAQKELLNNPAASLEQCRNGTVPTDPRSGCLVVGGNEGWVTGNAGSSNSNWAETQYLAYRMLFSNLPTGGTVHTVTIGYDVLKSGVHAIDYLGTYNLTETNANPCVAVSGSHCNPFLPGNSTTITIPVDPEIQNFPVPRATMPNNGVFTMWGGTLQSIAYVPYAGGEERRITLTFTASVPNPVLAWGGHVAWRGEWGEGNSAGGISGSPYHMRLIDLNGQGGNQDRSLSADAVFVPAQVTIVKRTLVDNQNYPIDLNFSFQSNAYDFDGSGDAFFTLNTLNNPSTGTKLITNGFGPANPYPVSEVGTPTNWSLNAITCQETGQAGFPGLQNTTVNLLTSTANIIAEEGETIVCTFDNVFVGPTAAPASISGRVTTAEGTGIGQVLVSVMNLQTGEITYAYTNSFGNYSVEGLEVEQTYQVSVWNRKMSFGESQRVVSLDGDLFGVDFVAESR